MTGDVRWMTYQEIADALGIGGDSARNLVRRKRWARQSGNDGLARIGVPVEHLAEHDGGTDGAADAPADPPSNGPADGGTIAALEGHVASLREEVSRLTAQSVASRADLEREQGRADALTLELAAIRQVMATVAADRDAERGRAGQVAVLEAVLELERKRAEEVRADLDHWRQTATAPRGLWAWLKRA